MHLRRHCIRVLSVKAFLRVLSLFAASLPVQAISEPVSFGDVLQLPVNEVAQTLAYGSSPLNTVVNIKGSDSSLGAVTLIHGGCWSNAYDRNHTLPMAEALSTMGYDVWVPEYRRVGDEGGGWPGSLEDIIAVVEFVTDKTGQQPILVGHSAGGHLALRAAQKGLAINGVVGLAPITDLVSYGAESGSCQSMVAPFMGDETYSPDESYRDASVTLRAINVPVSVVIGKEDPIVGASQVDVFDAIQVTTVEGAGHFDVIHPETEAFSAVVNALEAIKGKGR
ncbi:MAG: alpha/beta hydrolase [Pseudomonadota bacterium]|nr:alpha/beta hydrolase [Pseudomonadota bacterium]